MSQMDELSIFDTLKKEFSKIDPVAFAENHLEIDGEPFRFSEGSGYKFMADILRSLRNQAESKVAKPIVVLKGRQIGATILAGVISLYFGASGMYGTESSGRPPIRVLHLFPTMPLMMKYTKDKLEAMMRSSQGDFIATRSMKQDKKAKALGFIVDDSHGEKNFVGGNKIRIDAVGRDGDRIRGMTQDVALFDECQEMNKHAVENCLRVLTAAQYGPTTKGVQMFFGTPKESGSYLWELWEDSDQKYYQLGCIGCGHHFFLYTYGSDSWKKVWVRENIVQCPECEMEQDKSIAVDNGRWQATREASTAKLSGYHMNLMLSPRFTKEMVMDFDPATNPNRSERAWRNETIGEFFSSGGMPLTMEDIVENALDKNRGISKGTRADTNKIYTLGIDWGDKDAEDNQEGGSKRGQSYTVMVVMSCNQEGVFTIENAIRLKSNNFTHRVKAVEELFNRYHIKNAAADYMFGNDVVNFLQNEKNYRSKLLGCINSGSLGKVLSYDPKQTRVVVNMHMMVDEIFSMFKRGKIKFPVAGNSWDHLLWLMQQCASMEVKVGSKSGNNVKHYMKGTLPNDGLMAIMYAMIAYRFIATGGFATQNADHTKANFPTPMLAFAPKLR